MSNTVDLELRYTLPTYAKLPISVVRGEGAYVWDEAGNRYLDFYGGHCVTGIGHCPPRVVEAIRKQAGELIFYSNVVYSPVRAAAAKRLVEMCPAHLTHAFLCNSGTEANEAALKLARKATGRMHVIAMEGAFHGRTLGSLAATSSPTYRGAFEELLPGVSFVPFGDAAALDEALSEHATAAVILEPIQSMAGMIEAPEAYYQAIERSCRRAGAKLIFDEVQTGVGRTGTFSIGQQLGVEPDVVTMAKSLASGIPVGAVITTNEIADTVASGDQGTTFGGGMIAAAAMDATLRTIDADSLMSRTRAIFDRIAETARELGISIAGRGCLIGLDMGQDSKPIREALFASRVLTGSASNPAVIRLFPPMNTSDEDLDLFNGALVAACAAVTA